MEPAYSSLKDERLARLPLKWRTFLRLLNTKRIKGDPWSNMPLAKPMRGEPIWGTLKQAMAHYSKGEASFKSPVERTINGMRISWALT